jgi:hypothetical protein
VTQLALTLSSRPPSTPAGSRSSLAGYAAIKEKDVGKGTGSAVPSSSPGPAASVAAADRFLQDDRLQHQDTSGWGLLVATSGDFLMAMHIPTGRVTLEDIVRHLILEHEIRPSTPKWEVTLDETEKAFLEIQKKRFQ